MLLMCPKCGNAHVILSYETIDIRCSGNDIRLLGAYMVFDCQECGTVFEVSAEGWQVKEIGALEYTPGGRS